MSGRLRIVPASIELLDAWMDAAGWWRKSDCRTSYRLARWARVLAAVRGFDVVGLAGYVPGVEGSPVVIVHPDHREKGIGTRLLRRLAKGDMPTPWACTVGGARLCRRVGVKYKRVTG